MEEHLISAAEVTAAIRLLQGKRGLACDLDNVVTDTTPKVFEIIDNTFPRPDYDKKLSLQQLLHKYTHSRNIPYWTTKEALEFQNYLVHSPEFYNDLPLLPQAIESLHEINETIPIICYLTARPEVAKEVSEEYLKRHNAPVAPVILRPSNSDNHGFVYSNNVWKASFVKSVKNIVGLIDDERDLVHLLTDYNGALFVFGDQKNGYTSHLRRPCLDWPDTIKNVKKVFSK